MQEASFNELQSEGYLCCSRHHHSVINFTINSQTNYLQSNKQLIVDIIPLMEILRTENDIDYIKLNKPKSKAYVSISKKLKTHY